MRKSKRLLGIALVPCMVGSLLAGCTASSDTDATPDETETVTTAETEQTTAADSDNDAATEQTTPEETTEQEPEEPAQASGAAFVDVLKGVSAMESYRMSSTITVNQKTVMDGEDDEENNVVINLEALTDGKGNVSLTIGAEYEDDDLGIALDGDLLTISKVDDRMYLNLEGAYETVMDILGDDSAYIEQYASAFDLTMDDIESLLVLGIPVGDLDISKDSYANMEKAVELIYGDLEAAIDGLDEDAFTQDGDTFTLSVNNDNLLEVADAFIAAFEGNMDDIYDAYVDGMKKVDYTDQMETVIKAVVAEVVEGIENASEEELDEETKKQLEEEIQDALDEFAASMDEAIQELEDGKEEFLEEFEDAVEEYKDSREDLEEELKDSPDSVSAVLTITAEGEEGSRTITSVLKAEAVVVDTYWGYDEDDEEYSYDTTNYVTITVESVVEEGDVEITAPKKYTSLSKAIELAYQVYLTYLEYSDDGGDDYDDDWNDDDDDDWDFSYSTYTQEELEEVYGVTAKDNQVLACYTPDLPGVLISAYGDLEFYSPDDSNDFQMEFSDDADVSVSYSIYNSYFDLEFCQEYYDLEKINKNLYYYEPETSYGVNIAALWFLDDMTVQITFTADDEDVYDSYVDGDPEGFLEGLVELCEIVEPAE